MLFRNKYKNFIYFIVLILPLLLIFTIPNAFNSFKFRVISITSPAINLISFPLTELKKILYYHRTFKEYKRLKNENDYLKARLIGLEEVIRENTRLEQLLKFKRKSVYSSIAASVIGRNPSQWSSSMVIDKGSNDGIRQGLCVVNAQGVVGKVAEVSPKKSKIILLTDPQFSVAGLVQRPREVGLVTGSLQGVCRIKYLSNQTDIRLGDKVITSKLSSSFPENLLIGEIIRIVDDPQKPSVECIIRPAASFSQLEEVLVVLEE